MMAKGSNFLRGLCIAFNVLLVAFGIMLFLFGIIANSVKIQIEALESVATSPGVAFTTVVGILTIVLAILGAYSAYREMTLPLLLYAVLMSIELIVVLVIAITIAIGQPQVEPDMQRKFQELKPLHSTDSDLQQALSDLQESEKCCGLISYTDWETQIPPSCFCSPDYEDQALKCVSLEYPAEPFLGNNRAVAVEPKGHVLNLSCGQNYLEYLIFKMQMKEGMLFTSATIMVAAIVASLFLWHKLHKRPPASVMLQNDSNRVKYELRPQEPL
ncbi:CD63 antigen-like [Denticeps clupeoides]|uniref:Tetraspanin n=1 Tax=Denticeps clupeoides TaxID=299321 RepID=A0AAY4BPF7_9TELE|nr:CD63 antigen-like [Denticeps clupeoides]